MKRVAKYGQLVFGIALLAVASRGAAADTRTFCVPHGAARAAIDLKPGAGQTLAGVKVVLDYPEHAVTIPGFGNQPEVKARVTGVPRDFLMEANDLDDSLIVAIAGTTALPKGKVFTVELDRCKDTPPVDAKDFRCTVDEASTPAGVLVEGATCTVNMITQPKEKAR